VALQEGSTGAYAPTAAVVAVIDRYRDRGLPAPIDPDTLVRAGLTTESLAPRTVQSLKLLDLLDDAMQPTAELVALGKVPTDQFKERLAAVLRTAYADVFKFVDPATDDYARIRDQFRPYTPPSLRDRMATLFLGLIEYAGIVPEGRTKELTGRRPATSKTKSPRPTSSRSPRTASEPSSNGSEAAVPGPTPQSSTTPDGDSRTLKLKSGETLTITLSGPVLLLPKEDRTFVLQIIENMEDYEDKIEASARVQT
jgi:hypothetical protein